MSEVATHRWHNVAVPGSSFVPSPSGPPSSLQLSASLKCGLTAGHTCSVKETEWSRTIGARDGSNSRK